MKTFIIWGLSAFAIYHFFPLILLIGVCAVVGMFNGSSSESSSIFPDELKDPEHDPAWNGRDLNEIFDDSYGDWLLDGKREEYF